MNPFAFASYPGWLTMASTPPSRTSRATRAPPVAWGRLFRRMAPVTTVYFCYAWTLWLLRRLSAPVSDHATLASKEDA